MLPSCRCKAVIEQHTRLFYTCQNLPYMSQLRHLLQNCIAVRKCFLFSNKGAQSRSIPTKS